MIDCRSYTAAFANRAKGGGSECTGTERCIFFTHNECIVSISVVINIINFTGITNVISSQFMTCLRAMTFEAESNLIRLQFLFFNSDPIHRSCSFLMSNKFIFVCFCHT